MKIIFDYNRTIFDPDQQILYPGVFNLLENLARKHELFLVSKDEGGRMKKITDLGVDKFFKKIVFTNDKSTSLFKELVADENMAIIVGDRIRGEIFVGNKLGYVTVWLRQGKFIDEKPENEQQEPKHTINNISELEEIIKLYE